MSKMGKCRRTAGIEDVLEFVVRNHPTLAGWERERLEGWLLHHMQQAFVVLVSRDGAKIAGLAIARPLMNPNDSFDGYSFDYEGRCLYVAAMISDGWDTLRALAISLTNRFGVRPEVAWHRRSDGALTIRPAYRVIRRILRPAHST